jgi:hypothetical protein
MGNIASKGNPQMSLFEAGLIFVGGVVVGYLVFGK